MIRLNQAVLPITYDLMETLTLDASEDPWSLVLSHRYSEALSQYLALSRNGTRSDHVSMAEQSTALLCLGRLHEALEGFREANMLAMRFLNGEDSPYATSIGAVEWLLGDRVGAINTWRLAAERIARGKTKYADIAGGASEGLILWYGGVTAKDEAAESYALTYLTRLAKKSRIEYWPGPLAQLALGRKSFPEILKAQWQVDNLEAIVERARGSLFERRQLTQALFYLATRERSDGKESDCLRSMKRCAGLENPVLEVEWYLARGESVISS